jgi:hypothetical protein
VDFLVARDDLHRCRTVEGGGEELAPGQARLAIAAFGLTANNITYAKFGDAMSYWDFFPAEPGWGRVPVWGFAEVVESAHPALAQGTRVYGYLPPSSELVVTPDRVDARGFVDAAAHRAQLPAAYNRYEAVATDRAYDPAHEDRQMLLRPLFFTAFLIDDFLAGRGLLDGGAVVLSSASSKTASALAHRLAERAGAEVVGLTSARSVAFVEALGVYDRVVAYEDLGTLPVGRAAYVDMAGDALVRAAVHRHYGDALVHDAVVGATHHDRMGASAEALPGPAPEFFFAPDRVRARAADWGREGLEQRVAEAWAPYVEWTGGWLDVVHERGPEAVERTYLELLDGRVDPATAHVLAL